MVKICPKHELMSISPTGAHDNLVNRFRSETKNIVHIDYEKSYKSKLPVQSWSVFVYAIVFESISLSSVLMSLGIDNPLARLILDIYSKMNIGLTAIYVSRVGGTDDVLWRNLSWAFLIVTIVSFLVVFIIKSVFPKNSTFSYIITVSIIFSLICSAAIKIDSETNLILEKGIGQRWIEYNEQPMTGRDKTSDVRNTSLFDRMVNGERNFKLEEINSLNLQENDWISMRKDNKQIVYLVADTSDRINQNESKLIQEMIYSYAISMIIILTLYIIMFIGSERALTISSSSKKKIRSINRNQI